MRTPPAATDHTAYMWTKEGKVEPITGRTHCMCAANFRYYTVNVGENITMKRHAYSWINTKFRNHLRRVYSGHYSDNLCQKLPGDEFPAKIWFR